MQRFVSGTRLILDVQIGAAQRLKGYSGPQLGPRRTELANKPVRSDHGLWTSRSNCCAGGQITNDVQVDAINRSGA